MTRRFPDTNAPSAPPALETELVRLIDERVLLALQAARQDAPGADPAFASKPRAAKLLGVSTASLRRWQKAGRITRYAGGRVALAEVRRAITQGPAKPEPAPPAVDLASARARRTADDFLHRGGRS